MRPDLLKVVTTLMELSCEFDEESVINAISSLRDNWPGLTDIEQKEMSAIIKAYLIMSSDEDDYQESEHDSFSSSDYYNENSNYYNEEIDEKKSKKGFFKKR